MEKEQELYCQLLLFLSVEGGGYYKRFFLGLGKMPNYRSKVHLALNSFKLHIIYLFHHMIVPYMYTRNGYEILNKN